MSFQPNNSENVKRIVLPSGKTIEVVSFEEVAEQLASPAAEEAIEQTAAPAEGLHVCMDCDSKLVYPTDWEEEGPDKWYVDLHCPNCDWTGGGVFDQDILDEFDEELTAAWRSSQPTSADSLARTWLRTWIASFRP